MLSVAIPRVKGLDAGITHYNIEMSSTIAMEERLSDDTFVSIGQGSTMELFLFNDIAMGEDETKILLIKRFLIFSAFC